MTNITFNRINDTDLEIYCRDTIIGFMHIRAPRQIQLLGFSSIVGEGGGHTFPFTYSAYIQFKDKGTEHFKHHIKTNLDAKLDLKLNKLDVTGYRVNIPFNDICSFHSNSPTEITLIDRFRKETGSIWSEKENFHPYGDDFNSFEIIGHEKTRLAPVKLVPAVEYRAEIFISKERNLVYQKEYHAISTIYDEDKKSLLEKVVKELEQSKHFVGHLSIDKTLKQLASL